MTETAGGALPPGMVIGPDGKPCKACTAFRSFAGFKKKPGTQSSAGGDAFAAGTPSSTSSAAGVVAAGAALAGVTAAAEPVLPADCPPDVERLGRHTWTFLHTTASYFPPQPSQHQKSSMLGLLRALPTLYPCGVCADHLGQYMKTHPPEAAVEKGREALEGWLCNVHNEVNERLGKDKFNCANVPQRWRDGWADGHCDP
ncbi:Growth factor [Rhodotorula toruloides ATCC 204091]|uniref:Sulfhydryl oxidase n=1 Tax=Rhodotorula toruloides TaxID=5286 RepID=A0A0K3CNJ0_RHOTO|nr:Growth factor [Rhodotorula toruloides ATCC 204091]KAK4335826.1 Mitochondrial FAD-linked sulfhydryl oxidase ERV1 [Rhodotorula toruloides]PRQ73471.1 growth factor [Rhodotorula toruloides]